MSKEHLSKITVKLFFAVIYRNLNVFKRKPLKGLYLLLFLSLKGHKGRKKFCHLMAQLLCPLLPISR